MRVAGGQQLQGYSVQLVQHQGSVKGIDSSVFFLFFFYINIFVHRRSMIVCYIVNHVCNGARTISRASLFIISLFYKHSRTQNTIIFVLLALLTIFLHESRPICI